MSDKVLEPAGLTHTQYVFVCVLQSLESKRQKPTQNDLARLTDSDVTMTSHVLRTLQKRGLIERKHINGDERAKYPKLLPAGKQLIKRTTKIMDTFEQEYFLPINNNFDDLMQCLKDLTAGSNYQKLCNTAMKARMDCIARLAYLPLMQDLQHKKFMLGLESNP